MLKIVLYIAIALGAAMYFPQSRAVVLDASEPVLNPVLRWSTRGEMRRIARDLESESQAGGDFPVDQEEFAEWLQRNYEESGDSRRDPWGNTYSLTLQADSFGVVSPGPDGELGTGDEITIEGELESPAWDR